MCCACLVRASDRSRPGPRCGPCSLAAIVRHRRGLADLPGLARACRASISAATRRGAATCPGSHRPREALPLSQGTPPARSHPPGGRSAEGGGAGGRFSWGVGASPVDTFLVCSQACPRRFVGSAACARSSIGASSAVSSAPPAARSIVLPAERGALVGVAPLCGLGADRRGVRGWQWSVWCWRLSIVRSCGVRLLGVGNQNHRKGRLPPPQGPGMHQPLFCVVPPCLY